MKISLIAPVRAAVAAITALAAMSATAAPTIETVGPTVKAKAGQEVKRIVKSKVPGLYEVHTDTQLFYTDEKGEYMLFGAHVFSTKDGANHTQQRQDELIGYKFADLPLKDAIKIVRGDGKRVVVTFEDANCSYCRQLTKTLDEAGNMTHYLFLVGMLGPDSATKAKSVMCASDPGKAWLDVMAGKPAPAAPEAGAACTAPFARNAELAKKYRVQGTPAMFFTTGERSPGSLPLVELEKRLAK